MIVLLNYFQYSESAGFSFLIRNKGLRRDDDRFKIDTKNGY